MYDDWGRVKLAFDLEVVQMKTKQLGIRRKRVKGDTWHYKKYCEDVIRSANITSNYPNVLNIPNQSTLGQSYAAGSSPDGNTFQNSLHNSYQQVLPSQVQ